MSILNYTFILFIILFIYKYSVNSMFQYYKGNYIIKDENSDGISIWNDSFGRNSQYY